MSFTVVPEGLVAASAAVEELAAQLAANQAAAAPVIGAVLPPAADPVSLDAAAGFSANGLERAGIGAEAAEELGRSGLGVSESAGSYALSDLNGAAVYWGGLV